MRISLLTPEGHIQDPHTHTTHTTHTRAHTHMSKCGGEEGKKVHHHTTSLSRQQNQTWRGYA